MCESCRYNVSESTPLYARVIVLTLKPKLKTLIINPWILNSKQETLICVQ